MRRFLFVILAGAISAGVAVGFSHALTNWTPCRGEGLACSLDGTTGTFLALTMVVLSMLVFGLVLAFRPTTRAIFLALIGLLMPVELWALMTVQYSMQINGGLNFGWRAVQQFLQLVGTPTIAVIIQWAILRILIVPRNPSAQGG